MVRMVSLHSCHTDPQPFVLWWLFTVSVVIVVDVVIVAGVVIVVTACVRKLFR